MSGPKSDQAELKRQKKAELERQRQEKLRKIREETDKLNREISRTEKQFNTITSHFRPEIHKVERVNELLSVINDFNRLKGKYTKQLEKALSINVPSEPEAIGESTKKLSNLTNSIIADYFNEVKAHEEKINKYLEYSKIKDKFASITFSGVAEKLESIADFDFSLKVEAINKSDKIVVNIKERAAEIFKEIENYLNSESLQISDLKILSVIANNIYKTAFETESGFKSAETEYNTIKPNIAKNMEIFDEMYQDYYSEYIIYMEMLNKNKAVKGVILPKEKYKFDTIEHLKYEKDDLVKQSKLLSEKNFIREQIDEVMKAFGYNVSKEIVFGENLKGNNYLCIDKSGSSGIRIHLSDEKQVMMEVVAADSGACSLEEDSYSGLMLNEANLNDNDKNYLLSQMGSFCELHPRIVEELDKRGVVFNEKARKAIDQRYCKKIIIRNNAGEIAAFQNDLINNGAQYEKRQSKRNKLAEMILP